MIKDNKKINPFLGIAIGAVLIFLPILVMFTQLIYKLSQGLFMLIAFPFIIVGIYFLSLNARYLGMRIMARKLDESAIMMNSMTFLSGNYIITKIKSISDLYIIKFSDNYLNIMRMNEKTNISVSWYRRTFGPKLPTNLPIKCPVLTEFKGFKIRKCEGKAILYDIDENQWFSGQATMFSIFFYSKSMKPLLPPETFQSLINLIDQSN